MKPKYQFILFFIFIGLLTHCKKHDPVLVYADMNMHIHLNLGDQEIEALGTIYTDSSGRETKINEIAFYISHIQLIKLDGSAVDVPVKRILKTLENEEFNLGQVPVGNYKSVRFHVGLDATDNATDPSAAADTVLRNHPEMWAEAPRTHGNYYFFKSNGGMSADTNKINLTYWLYLGTSQNYVEVNLPDKPFTVLSNQANWCHVVADLNALIYPFDKNKASSWDIPNLNENLMTKASIWPGRLQQMFRYE